MLSLGQYPAVSLAEARTKCADERAKLDAGKDPSDERKHAASSWPMATATSRRWPRSSTSMSTPRRPGAAAEDSRERMERWVYKYLKGKSIGEIKYNDLLSVLQRIEDAGKHETARRARSDISRVFVFAQGLVQAPSAVESHAPCRRPQGACDQALPYPPIARRGLARYCGALDAYEQPMTGRIALQLLPHLMLLPW